MDRITCDIVRDMMPLCVDGVCSENSKQLVENHIKECAMCKEQWESYCDSSIPDKIKDDNSELFKEFANTVKKKNRRKTIFAVLSSICISIIAMICFGFIILGLLSLGDQSYTTIDSRNYGIYEGHIDAEKEDLQSGLYIFPDKISKNAMGVEFLYSCRGVGFSNAYQQFLKCTYNDEEYRFEIERLKKITCEISTKNGVIVNRVEYSATKFSHPAYITADGGLGLFEYALCDESTKTIIYIIFQDIAYEKVAFSKEYLPIEYQKEKQLQDSNSMDKKNIYYCYIGNGVYQSFKDK